MVKFVMVNVYCRCMIYVLCLYFAQKPFSSLSRDACSINSSVNQERLSMSTKPREFEIHTSKIYKYARIAWYTRYVRIALYTRYARIAWYKRFAGIAWCNWSARVV